MSRKIVGALGVVVVVMVAIIGIRILLSEAADKTQRADELQTLRTSIRKACSKARSLVTSVKRRLVPGGVDGMDDAQSMLVSGLVWFDLCAVQGSKDVNFLEHDPARMLQILEDLEQQLSAFEAGVEASES